MVPVKDKNKNAPFTSYRNLDDCLMKTLTFTYSLVILVFIAFRFKFPIHFGGEQTIITTINSDTLLVNYIVSR